MKCPKCGADLADGVLFCRECGARVDAVQKRFCRECGAVLKSNAKFCSNCGAKVEILTDISPEGSLQAPDSSEELVDSLNVDQIISEVQEENTPIVKQEKAKSSSAKKTGRTTSGTGKRKPTPKKKRTNAKPLIIALVAVLILIIAISVLGKGGGVRSANAPPSEPKVKMVNVVNMGYPAALNVLQSAGFTNITSNVDPNTDESQWVVTEQNISAGKTIKANEKIELTCGRRCSLYIDVKSEDNLLFSTYDITITLDGIEIGAVADGKGFTFLKEVVTGEHTLVFCKSGSSSPKATKKFLVSNDMTFSCDLAHSGSDIEIKNESRTDNISGAALEVIDVTGMILAEAKDKLKDIGFSNIREEPFNDIWDKNNWLVVSQGLSAGSVVDKNEFFQLDCISLDDYFNNTYVGRNVNEIENLANESGFSIKFEDTSYQDLNDRISSMSQEEKNEWTATKARQYNGANKTAVVIINNPNEVKPTPTPVPEPTQTPSTTTSESKNNSVSYSTNDKSTVKKGDSGVYAYRNRGNSYYVYYIIDFDEGYVYRFVDGNGDGICEKVKIDSGNLNDGVQITYDEGGLKYSNWLHFKWKNQPDHLILVDDDYYDWDFYTTNLDDAIRIRNSKKIVEY